MSKFHNKKEEDMKQDNYKVYIHKNKLNGKVYIGITSQPVNQRWRNGTNYYGNEYFNNSIKKYGWNNFEHEVLYDGLTKEEAEQIEIELIKHYNSTNRDKGYNIENGGNTTGKHSEETKRKISESQKGGLNHMARKVICLNNNEIFGSIIEASKYAHCAVSTLIRNLKDENYSAGIFNGKKLTWMYLNEYEDLKNKESYVEYKINKTFLEYPSPMKGKPSSSRKQIICLNHNKVFDSLSDASQFYNISTSGISMTLNKNAKGVCIDNDFLIFEFLTKDNYYDKEENVVPLYLTRGNTLKVFLNGELFGFYPSVKYFCNNVLEVDGNTYRDVSKVRYYINNHNGVHKNIEFKYSTHKEYIEWYYGNN